MSILSEILASKRTEVDCARRRIPLEDMKRRAEDSDPARDFVSALRDAPSPALIAEIKKASPSKGVIRADFSPVEIAYTYAEGGAACLSVLTDEPYFQGHLSHLCAVREAVSLPLLRKDFMVDEYQIYESRAAGADAVLLIVAALERTELESMLALSESLGMAVLVEVHDSEELDTAIGTNAKLIGINNRDLHQFRTTLQTTIDLIPQIPPDRIIISESGINTREDVERLAQAGVHAILVGESLVREPDIASKLRELLQR